MNPRVFANGMAQLAAAYGGRDLPDDVLATYKQYLGDLGDVEFKRAVIQAIRERLYFPSVAELRQLALGDLRERALNGLADVERLMGRYGGLVGNIPPEKLAELGTTTLAGLRAAGWLDAVRNATTDTRPRLEKAFVEGFIVAAEREAAMALATGEVSPERIALPPAVQSRVTKMAEWAAGDDT
jgi:hypothetical protein